MEPVPRCMVVEHQVRNRDRARVLVLGPTGRTCTLLPPERPKKNGPRGLIAAVTEGRPMNDASKGPGGPKRSLFKMTPNATGRWLGRTEEPGRANRKKHQKTKLSVSTQHRMIHQESWRI